MPRLSIHSHHATVSTLLGKRQKLYLQAVKESEANTRTKIIQRKIRAGIVQRSSAELISNHSFSAALTLAHLLYPKNFPKVIATGIQPQSNKSLAHSKDVFTRRVPLSKESQEAIEKFYDLYHDFENKYEHYEKKYAETVMRRAQQIFEQSGIETNYKMVNVGVNKHKGKDNFVFFEVWSVNLPKLGRFINDMPKNTPQNRLRFKQALEIFHFLRKEAGIRDSLHTHKGV